MAGRAVLPCHNIHTDKVGILGVLEPGRVDICHFRLLMTLGRIKKPGMQGALEEVLVRGATRREACERYGVSQSQFSVKFRQLQVLNQTAARMYPFIAAGSVSSGM
ncbi:transcriptional regulator [Salmonella enterica]|uniref:Transcriptional regulator n=1 Tax=Salmonella enterica TaxID=28901 RepID=A0A5T4LND5_SALER|nr:transcriptional regulator [Salmonella enterica]EBL7518578.1 transcriptional regulator [Salmonella enterica]